MRQPRQPKEIPPPLELECLKALWAIGEGNVRAVQAQMEARRKLAYTTVMT
ncbi:MAG: BlaI/MecI/CopY family transcriptional regulator, partial [Bryobacterales bacterium]|nr:BlaI/MecI/CopY family transcriptional regulator [Bryobacterales bacterium]